MSPLPTRGRRTPSGIAGFLAAAILLVFASIGLSFSPAHAQSSPLVIDTIGLGTESAAPPVFDDQGGVRLVGQMAALDADTLVYFGGGFMGENETVVGDTWLLDDDLWTPVCGTEVPGADQPCGPSPRTFHALGHAPAGGVILYGGTNSMDVDDGVQIYGDTWLFDGSSWTPICGTATPGADHDCGPGPRAGTTMMESMGQTFLFSGFGDDAPANDVWRFTGTAWTLVNDGSGQAPEARAWSQATSYGGGSLLFGGGVVPEDGGGESQGGDSSGEDGGEYKKSPSAGLIYSPSPSPLRAEVPTYAASASPLSFNGFDYTSTGPGGGSGQGATFLSAGEWYQSVGTDNDPLRVVTAAGTSYDVALVDYGSGQRGTIYIESRIFDHYGANRDCSGADSVLSSYNDGGFSASCENFGPSILKQSAPGTNFDFMGYGGFENGGPVAEVNDPAWTPGTDPFITVTGSENVDHEGPCCGQPDRGAMFGAQIGDGPHWISQYGQNVHGLDNGGSLSSVHVGLISVNQADLTFYMSREAFDSGGYTADCDGLIRMWTEQVSSPDPVGCRNFKKDIFTPNAPGEDYGFEGFGGFNYAGTVSETPQFSGDGDPTLVYVGEDQQDEGGGGDPVIVSDTWLWNPAGMTWTPVCGTKISGADQPCGPSGRLGAGLSPIVSLDPSLSGALMTSGLVPLDEGMQILGDIWLFAGDGWQQLQSPWSSLTLGDEEPVSSGTPAPIGIRTAAVASECRVAAFGVDTQAVLSVSQGQDPEGVSEFSITMAMGFDTTGEGEIDPCAAPSSSSSPSSPGAGLAFTGSSTGILVVLGGTFVLLGGAMTKTSRRRRA